MKIKVINCNTSEEMTRDIYPFDLIRHCYLNSTIDFMMAYADVFQ